jgi:catechol 2,3-dioxygenase-like lactoylglutathione lyase family enzyme
MVTNGMASVHSGSERVRAFLPTRDFERSKQFYEAIGFEKVLDGDVAIFNAGSGGFILQRGEDTQNMMMQLMVDDLDAWWTHIASLDLAAWFGVPAPRPPAVQPWGLRIVYVTDPAGVLWHVAERRAAAPQDR